jgi:hypothetical protein
VTEISKEMKIIFLINAIASFLFAFFFLGIPEIYATWTNEAYFSPICWRQIGGTLLIFGIFTLIALFRKEWEQLRLFYEFGIAFIIVLICIDIWIAFYGLFDYTLIVEIVLVAINIIFYIRERK